MPDLDRRITAWLDDRAQPRTPDDLLGDTLARTSRLRRRPAWRIPERWIPMPITLRLAVVPRAVIYLLLLALLVAMLAAGGSVVGSLRNAATVLPPPTGPARNGLIAFPMKDDLWTIQPDGTGLRSLTSDTDLDFSPLWSPDGTHLAYWSVPYDGAPDQAARDAAIARPIHTIKVIRADGSGMRTLAAGIRWPADCATDLTWSPGSDRVAFAYVSGEGSAAVTQIDMVDLDGTGRHTLVKDGASPNWSPDGISIAYATGVFGSDGHRFTSTAINVAPVAGGEPRRVTRTTGSGCAFDEPRWSPDSTRIAFYDNADGLHDIVVASADGSAEQQISVDLADEYWPTWSPDGTRIAFDRVVLPDHNAPQFVLTDPDGGNEVMLDHPALYGRYPTWSPDGRLLVGLTPDAADEKTLGLTIVDVHGDRPASALAIGDIQGDPTWQRLAS